jgi:hypothetical protein
MKNSFMFKKPGQHHAAVRSVRELAAEFGIHPRLLGRMLASDPAAPACQLDNSVGFSNQARYFELQAAREWWKNRPEGQG